MKTEQEDGPQGYTLHASSEHADDTEAVFQLPKGKTYLRDLVVLIAKKGQKPMMCTMESSSDGIKWQKGCIEKMTGTLHIRLTDGGDRRQAVIYISEAGSE